MERVKIRKPVSQFDLSEVECRQIVMDGEMKLHVTSIKKYIDDPLYKVKLIGGDAMEVNHRYIMYITPGKCVKVTSSEADGDQNKTICSYYFIPNNREYELTEGGTRIMPFIVIDKD